MDFEKLEALAAEWMKDGRWHKLRETGSVYYHGLRVSRGVLQLRRAVTDDGQMDDCLRCAALLHDMGKGEADHARCGAELARDRLSGYLTAEELERVCRLIAVHDDRKPGENAFDVWEMLLQDADILDHVGTQEIWMCCNYYARQDRPFEAMAEWYPDEFEKQMRAYERSLNFMQSKRILTEKVEFQRRFMERYLAERTGGYWENVLR